MDPRIVIRYMRALARTNGLTFCPPDVRRYIKAERLMTETEWPCYVIKVSPKGTSYIEEHLPDDDE